MIFKRHFFISRLSIVSISYVLVAFSSLGETQLMNPIPEDVSFHQYFQNLNTELDGMYQDLNFIGAERKISDLIASFKGPGLETDKSYAKTLLREVSQRNASTIESIITEANEIAANKGNATASIFLQTVLDEASFLDETDTLLIQKLEYFKQKGRTEKIERLLMLSFGLSSEVEVDWGVSRDSIMNGTAIDNLNRFLLVPSVTIRASNENRSYSEISYVTIVFENEEGYTLEEVTLRFPMLRPGGKVVRNATAKNPEVRVPLNKASGEVHPMPSVLVNFYIGPELADTISLPKELQY